MTDEYYNTEEACMLLKLGRTTVYMNYSFFKILQSLTAKSVYKLARYRVLFEVEGGFPWKPE